MLRSIRGESASLADDDKRNTGRWNRFSGIGKIIAMKNQDEVLSAAILARLVVARKTVAAKMAQHGLREQDGWRIAEELRTSPYGTQFVLRPIHTRLDSPGFEATVTIDNDGCPR